MIYGWALIIPIAVFNIVVGLWAVSSARRHLRYIEQAEANGDSFFMQMRDAPGFPGPTEIKRERLRGIALILSGIVILFLFYAPALFGR